MRQLWWDVDVDDLKKTRMNDNGEQNLARELQRDQYLEIFASTDWFTAVKSAANALFLYHQISTSGVMKGYNGMKNAHTQPVSITKLNKNPTPENTVHEKTDERYKDCDNFKKHEIHYGGQRTGRSCSHFWTDVKWYRPNLEERSF